MMRLSWTNIIHVEMPHGGTGRKRKIANLDKYLTNKRAIVRIQNKGNLCLSRATVVANAKVDNDTRHKHISHSERPLQGELARELHEKANVPLAQYIHTYIATYIHSYIHTYIH